MSAVHLEDLEKPADVDITSSPAVTGVPVAPALRSLARLSTGHFVSLDLAATEPVDRAAGDPMDRLIAKWVGVAVRHARVRPVDDLYVADVVGLPGAWAEGDTADEALDALPDVLTEWVRLKLDDGDRDIPDMEGVRLLTQE